MNTDIAPLRLRAATADDLQGIRHCIDLAYTPYIARMGREPAPMLDDYAKLIAAQRITVADLGGTIIGLLVLSVAAEGFLLETVAVLPTHHGKGVGKALLQFAEHEARRGGFDSLYLYTHETMTENQSLYSKIGYVEYARRCELGLKRIYMRKRLQ